MTDKPEKKRTNAAIEEAIDYVLTEGQRKEAARERERKARNEGKSTKPTPQVAAAPDHGNMRADVRTVKVEDPGYQRQHDGAKGNSRLAQASINMRESPAALWYHKHKSINEAQFMAASRFRQLWETAAAGGSSAIDYTREPVDGGGRPDPIQERQVEAADKLKIIAGLMSDSEYNLLCKVCGDCRFLADIFSEQYLQRKGSQTCKDLLTLLSVHFGYEQRAA